MTAFKFIRNLATICVAITASAAHAQAFDAVRIFGPVDANKASEPAHIGEDTERIVKPVA